jgi:hypothetical protein
MMTLIFILIIMPGAFPRRMIIGTGAYPVILAWINHKQSDINTNDKRKEFHTAKIRIFSFQYKGIMHGTDYLDASTGVSGYRCIGIFKAPWTKQGSHQ